MTYSHTDEDLFLLAQRLIENFNIEVSNNKNRIAPEANDIYVELAKRRKRLKEIGSDLWSILKIIRDAREPSH